MITYHIPLTGLKVSTNKIYAGQHWSKRKESADAILGIARWFCRPIQKIESYPVEICYKFVFVTKALDTTNCSYMVKMLEDALRSLEILKDDSPQYVARTIIESHGEATKKTKKGVKLAGAKDDEKKSEDRVEIIIKPL